MSRHISFGLGIGQGSWTERTSSTLGELPTLCESHPLYEELQADWVVVSRSVHRWNLRSLFVYLMVSSRLYLWLTAVVNPDRIPGKVIIIGRYGADKVDKHLPGHIEAVKGTDHVVVWQCDAMVSSPSFQSLDNSDRKARQHQICQDRSYPQNSSFRRYRH